MKKQKITYVCNRCGQTTTMTGDGECVLCLLDKMDQLSRDLSAVREWWTQALDLNGGFVEEIANLNDEIVRLTKTKGGEE